MQNQTSHETIGYQAGNSNFRFNTRHSICRMTYQITRLIVPYNFAIDHKKFGLGKKKLWYPTGDVAFEKRRFSKLKIAVTFACRVSARHPIYENVGNEL